MKSLKDHISKRHTQFETTPPTKEEEKRIQFEGLEEAIFKRLTSTKFRKKSITKEQEEAIRKAIKLNVSKNKPLIFTHSFGAYKIWRVPSFPHPDWAEFMSLSWFFKYASYICGIYPPGVEYQFLSQDCCITMLDNYPKEKLDIYREGFLKLFESFKPHLPDNLNITFKRLVPDIYTQEEYEKDLEDTVKEFKKTPLTQERIDELMVTFEFNTLLDGEEDLTKLSKEELKKRFEKLLYYADGILLTPKNVEYETGEEKILVFEIPLLPYVLNSIAIGSTAVSRTLHWAGFGIFEHANEKFYDRVLSPTQYEKVKDKLEETNIGNLIPGMSNNVNFYQGRLSFLP